MLCHIPRANLSGMGQKVPDVVGALGCYSCHGFMDNRDLSAERRRLREQMVASGEFYAAVLDGLCRTLALWDREGFL